MKLYYTVDVDRDVNIQIPGRKEAGSIDRGAGTAPRFGSSDRGLRNTTDMLDVLGMKGTFFIEGRTAETIDCSQVSGHGNGIHGYDHEDLTSLSDIELDDTIRMAVDAVTDNAGKPTCSRSPYMTADARVLKAFRDVGIAKDSSFYTPVGGPTKPYDIDGTIEVPVPKAKDASGKTIVAYLWPMHEGKRSPEDYIEMAKSIDGPMVLADHSWHMVETRDGGPIGKERERQEVEKVTRVLEGIADLGFEPSVLRRSEDPDCFSRLSGRYKSDRLLYGFLRLIPAFRTRTLIGHAR